MKKFFTYLGLVIAGGYFLVLLIVGSSPVQKRVLGEVQKALSEMGIDLEIESIEFSAFAPKLYLNRVVLKTNPKSEIQLEHPLDIDKIKVEFQPWALLSRQIVIEEAALFHPRVLVPRADKLYKRIKRLLEQRDKLEVKGSKYPVSFKKLGIVDAQVEVSSEDPSFSVRSRSLTLFLSQNTSGQQTILAESPHLELDRGPLKLRLSALDADVDMTEKSLRANRLIVKGEGIQLNWKGAVSLPFSLEKAQSSLHLSHETQVDIGLLNAIPELGAPNLKGEVWGQGTFHLTGKKGSGTGTLSSKGVFVDGYQIGEVAFGYSLNDTKALLSEVKLGYGGGLLESDKVEIDFTDRLPLKGDFRVAHLHLEKILDSVKTPDSPVMVRFDGRVGAHGFLAKPFFIQAEPDLSFAQLVVVNDAKKPVDADNRILQVAEGKLKATLGFSEERMQFGGEVRLLGGKVAVTGALGFNGRTQLQVDGKDLSLTELKDIGGLSFGGKADVTASGDFSDTFGRIQGKLSVEGAEIADLILGSVKAEAQYQADLLSFSNIQMKALDAVRGTGFVDFRPKDTHYRFDVDGKRISTQEILSVFSKTKLPFENPKGGELGARVVIEGGHDNRGVDVTASGQARAIRWYDEDWMSVAFGFRYRPDETIVNRGVLLKRSGALEIKARYNDSVQNLSFYSSGLRLEELNHLGKSPLSGEVQGSVVFDGDLTIPQGNGNLRFSKLQFRGEPLPVVDLKLRSDKSTAEYVLNAGEALGGTLTRYLGNKTKQSILTLKYQDFDWIPLVSLALEKDLPPIKDIRGTGALVLKGDFSRWDSLSGSGNFDSLKVGLKGNPLRSQEPVSLEVREGLVRLSKINLVGQESQVNGKFELDPGKRVEGSFDLKLDLQFLQPFIPGIEYGEGLVTAGMRFSGTPKSYDLFGNVLLQEGTFRLTGLTDEFRNANLQMGVSPDKLIVEKFQAGIAGGNVTTTGEVRIDRFRRFSPNLGIFVSRAALRLRPSLKATVTGDLTLKGDRAPYLLAGRVQVQEATLSDLSSGPTSTALAETPALAFDIKCDAPQKVFLATDVIDAEFKADVKVTGDTNEIGLLGTAEGIRGSLIFKDTRFNLENAVAKFEDPKRIFPRFSVAGRALVREQQGKAYQDYDVNLQVVGTPADYKIRLTSTPPLSEPDLISLLVLGATTRSQEGNYFDLGSTIMGQSPLQSKIQSEFGFDIKVKSAPGTGAGVGSEVGAGAGGSSGSGAASAGSGTTTGPGDASVPEVKIEKGITKRTKVSYSNTLDQNPTREFRLEQMLNENFTVNATAGDRGRNSSQARPGDSFGLDFRYRFDFE